MKQKRQTPFSRRLTACILSICMAIGLVFVWVPPLSAKASDSACQVSVTGTASYDYANEILSLVNTERANNGLSALTMDADLLDAAMQRAAEQAVFYGHDRPDGRTCFTASSKMYGENIAAGYASPSAVMSGWMSSDGHKKNILGSYTTIGIGCFKHNGTWYWVQCFGYGQASATSASGSTSSTKTVSVSSDYMSSNIVYLWNSTNKVAGGSSLSLELWGRNQGWTYVEYWLEPTSVNWSSSNSAIAVVNSHGIVSGLKKGTVTITASLKQSPYTSYTYTVTVTSDAPAGFVPPSDTPASGWKQDTTGWWYQRADGSYPAGCWEKIDDVWYMFNASGYMLTGWQKDGDTWYYLKSSGAMATGWIYDGGSWYYLRSSGAMATGWIKDGNTWYYLKPSGAMATGWIKDGNTWYYLYGNGSMAQSTWIGSYYVDASGAWVE